MGPPVCLKCLKVLVCNPVPVKDDQGRDVYWQCESCPANQYSKENVGFYWCLTNNQIEKVKYPGEEKWRKEHGDS